MLQVHVYRHGKLQEQVDLTQEDFPAVIGRAGDAQVRIEDRSVSRHHAQLTLAGEKLVLTDLGARNGTYVGERAIETKVVDHDDEATIGVFKLVFKLEARMKPTRVRSPYEDLPEEGGQLTMRVGRNVMREVATRRAVMRPSCLLHLGPNRKIPLKHQVCFLGRSNLCDVIVKGWGIAPRHALVLKQELAFRLYDLTGRKRITVDGERISEIKLTDGMRFRLGRSQEFQFLEGGMEEKLSDSFREWFER